MPPPSDACSAAAFRSTRRGAVRVRDPGSGRLLAAGEAGEIEGRGAEPHARVLREPGRHPETMTGDGFVRSGRSRIPHGRWRLRVPRADGGRHAARRIPGESGRDRGGTSTSIRRCAARKWWGWTPNAVPRPVAFVVLDPGGGFDEEALRAIAGGPSRASRCRRASSRWTSSRPRRARTERRSAARSSAASRRSDSPRLRPPLLRSPPAGKSRASSAPMNSRSASADRSARPAAAAGPDDAEVRPRPPMKASLPARHEPQPTPSPGR